MITIIKEQEINRPVPPPVRSSILDHATFVQKEGGFNLRNNEGLWPTYNCMDTLVSYPLCPDPALEVSPKTFSFGEWTPGFQFAVYGAVQCAALGLDVEDMSAEVRRVFSINEGKGVERALLLNRFVEREVDLSNPIGWGEPVDLTPTAPVSLVVALALLEGYAAHTYAGRPTIHMPVAASTVLEASGLIVWNGDKAYTKNGSAVAMGGGYDAPLFEDPAAVPGAWNLYATGEVYVEASERINVRSFTMGSPVEDTDLDPNTQVALVERMFRAGVDCFVAKATGTVWA